MTKIDLKIQVKGNKYSAPLPRSMLWEMLRRKKMTHIEHIRRVMIPDDLAGRDVLVVKCPQKCQPDAILVRYYTTIEGWLKLRYYLGVCPLCGTFFWGS